MKNKSVLFVILLTLALLSAACAGQEATQAATQAATDEPGAATAVPTTAATDSSTATVEAGAGGEAMTPAGTVEVGTPASGTDGAAVIPQTGPGDAGVPDDLDEVVRVLRETGATVEFGDAVEDEPLSVPGQTIMIDGEEVQIFTYSSADELEVQVSQIAPNPDPEEEPQLYKLGSMLVRYVGTDPGVRDLLEDVLGGHAAGE